MLTDVLDNVLKARPFRPFLVRTADGLQWPVRHPEQVFKLSTGRTIIVDHGDGRYDTIDTILIASIGVDTAAATPPAAGNGEGR